VVMEEQLLEEHMRRLDAKISAIGFPEEYTRIMREKVDAADGGYFHLYHNTMISSVPVEVAHGFQERHKGSRYFEPDLMSVQLGPGADNIVDKNIFFLPTGSDVSIREAFNLMQGRAIRRDSGIPGDQAYWMRLNVEKEFNGIRSPYVVKGHLDVGAWMRGTPVIKLFDHEERAGIVKSLEHGDRFLLDRGKAGKVYLEANPEKDRVNLKNERGKLVRVSQLDERVKVVHRKR